MPIVIRQMRNEDIRQVAEIDQDNFPKMQPQTNYKRELTNKLSYYIVACNVKSVNIKKSNIVIGVAGFWLMVAEAHIVNLAVKQVYHQKGIGELLLINILDLALEKNADLLTLEVRVSNNTAINLYQKYGFFKRGIRRGYYLDDQEDAVIMTTDNIKTRIFQNNLNILRKKHQQKWGNRA
ncbi:MAG: ribosomal protein S18-alanine N-acetyltransferase [Dehalococcoidia bacterium]|nr:MAG: ribosomal protein S18-alanine N-acetyltransferase [Dehalococcoidia bacterium]